MKTLKIILTSLIAALACTGIIYAATTVGSNISTTGTITGSGANTLYGATSIGGAITATSTLNVSGLTTLGNASTTLLSVSGNLDFATASSTGIVKFSQINSDTGAISFGDDNLTTTGTLNITGLTTLGNASTTILSVSGNSYLATTTVTGDFIVTDGIHKEAKFIVVGEGGDYTVYDGKTNAIVSSGSNAITAVQYALDNLTSGRTLKESVVLKGDFAFSSFVTLPSYTRVKCDGAKITTTNTKGFRLYPGIRNHDIEINGCELTEDTAVITQNFINITNNGGVAAAVADAGNTGSCVLTMASTAGREESIDFNIEIDADGTPDTFMWSNDGEHSYTTGVAITGSPQILSGGITVSFNTTTCGASGDKWTAYTNNNGNIKILNNKFFSAANHAIFVTYTSGFEISDNLCSGVHAGNCFDISSYANDGVIIENTLEYTSATGVIDYSNVGRGISIHGGAYDIGVNKNIIRNTAGIGLSVYPFDADDAPHDIIVTGNIIHDMPTKCVQLYSGANVLEKINFSNNNIKSCGISAGIQTQYIQNSIISENIISPGGTDSGQKCIAMQAGSNYNTVSNNICSDVGSVGIFLNNSSSNIIDANYIVDADAEGGGNRAMLILGNNNNIQNNRIRYLNNSTMEGISVAGTSNSVQGNIIENVASSYIADSGTNTLFQGNLFGTLPMENEGVTGTIASGDSVAHGLAGTPDYVIVTPGDSGVTDFYATPVDATNFTITYSGVGTHVFYWRAVYKP